MQSINLFNYEYIIVRDYALVYNELFFIERFGVMIEGFGKLNIRFFPFGINYINAALGILAFFTASPRLVDCSIELLPEGLSLFVFINKGSVFKDCLK